MNSRGNLVCLDERQFIFNQNLLFKPKMCPTNPRISITGKPISTLSSLDTEANSTLLSKDTHRYSTKKMAGKHFLTIAVTSLKVTNK